MSDVTSPPRRDTPPTARPGPHSFSNRKAEQDWSTSVTTNSGTTISITPARAGDREALESFFQKVTPEDLYFRFLSGIREVDEDRLNAMLRDDDDRAIDFLALDSQTGEILATAMLVADETFDRAEFAVCTRADAKKKGISWALLEHAAQYADAMGVNRIFSLQSSNQIDALQLEREMGFTVKASPGDPLHKLVEKTFA